MDSLHQYRLDRACRNIPLDQVHFEWQTCHIEYDHKTMLIAADERHMDPELMQDRLVRQWLRVEEEV
jgi:hypothetical protein